MNVLLPVAALLRGGRPPPIVFGRVRIKAYVCRKRALNFCFPPSEHASSPFQFLCRKQSAARKVSKLDQPRDICPRCCSLFQGHHQIHDIGERRFLDDGRLRDTASKHRRSRAPELSTRLIHLERNEIFTGANQQQKETEGLD